MTDDVRQQAPIDPEVEAQQRRAAVRTALILTLIILAIGIGAFWYMWNWRASMLEGDESVNVLFLGVSEESIEALYVASFNPAAPAVAALAVPVDTVLPGAADAVRLSDVYDGASEADWRLALEQLLGAPIHHTVRIDFSGFVELIDLLSGVAVEVDTDVVYRDGNGEVTFALEPGIHRLTGQQALLYVRYKGDHLDDETRRVERQRRLMEAVVREARAKFDWTRLQELLRIAMTYVETDLNWTTAARLARFAYDLGLDAYHLYVLPGWASEAGWVVDEAALQVLSGQLFAADVEAARR